MWIWRYRIRARVTGLESSFTTRNSNLILSQSSVTGLESSFATHTINSPPVLRNILKSLSRVISGIE